MLVLEFILDSIYDCFLAFQKLYLSTGAGSTKLSSDNPKSNLISIWSRIVSGWLCGTLSRLSAASGTLAELNLGMNRLSSLPSEVGQFQKLLMLDLRNNQLSALPDEMENLSFLRELTISCNRWGPLLILLANHIRVLWIKGNIRFSINCVIRFQTIPSVVYKLHKLEVLLASDNQLQEVDASGICGLSRLATLDLQNNDIAVVPPHLGNATQLR